MPTKMADDPLWQQWAKQMTALAAREQCAVCDQPVVKTRHKAYARCCEVCAGEMTLDLTNTAVVPRRSP
jgi:hypothetical protein